MNILYIRCENNQDEYRTPIIPEHVEILIKNGFTIYVETSKNRIYTDIEYFNKGAIITTEKWYLFKNALIIGLKEINLEKLNGHTHMYFSHSFKNQINSKNILNSFKNSNSMLYDFEYFIDSNNKRFLSFGLYAGIAGCILGLLQYLEKLTTGNNIKNLTYFENFKEINFNLNKIKINIIGPYGNVGLGVRSVLDEIGIKYDINIKNNFNDYDILYNCIKLDESCNETWFLPETIVSKKIIICDISCDYSKLNNPIKLYNNNTTWKDPVYSFNEFIDIIAINNLPSLLPKESSDYFSNKVVELLLLPNSDIWKNNEKYFKNLINV